jgi:hypothetical protein
MVAREAKVLALEKNLYPLYFEISVLKRRVDDVHPSGGGECCRELRALVAQYRSVEAMVQKLKESSDQVFEESFAAVERTVEELVRQVSALSPWIMMQLADRFSPVY